MIVSKSNFASDATVSILPESATQDISVIVDGDYSSVYSDALQSQAIIDLEFGEIRNVEYLAIGGSNISTKDSLQIQTTQTVNLLEGLGDNLLDGNGDQLTAPAAIFLDDTMLGLKESRVIMYKLDATQISGIRIIVKGTGQLKIAEIACGEIYTIPNGGEQSGYNRPWSVPNRKNRSATNLQNAPINLSYESRALSCTLSIPNLIMTDYDSYYEFIDYATFNTFYVLEDDNKYHSYAGFNAVPDMTKAHSSTRRLGVSMIKFNAYSQENEVIF